MSAVPASEKVTRWVAKPACFNSPSSTPSAPASAGVTDGQRIRSRAMASASVTRSVPQQLVDRGLGAGALVDPLHDHGAGGRGADLAVLHRLARQRARDDHGIFRYLADEHL